MTPFYHPTDTSVILLAAGHGKRMLPLTEHTPKPLLKVGEYALIEHHLQRLQQLGFQNIVINIAHLGEQIPAKLGAGERYGLRIKYSDESDSGALETAGGLHKALPLIESNPFITINADIWTDFDFRMLLSELNSLGRLVMVNNPEHNQGGDFNLDNNTGLLTAKTKSENNSQTYSGIALYKKEIFEKLTAGKQALPPIFNQLIEQKQLEGIMYEGAWSDIGTPARLTELNKRHKVSQ